MIVMAKMTRREFMRYLALGTSAATLNQFLAACGQSAESLMPMDTAKATWTKALMPTETRQSPATTRTEGGEIAPQATTERLPEPTPTPLGSPDLVVARGGQPEELVRHAMAALGGMEQIVSKGADVIIKPNICHAYHTYEYATTTNPWVVAALVKLCLEAGASRVRVMDYPFGGTPEQAYIVSGIAEQVALAGGEMAFMPGFKYVATAIPMGRDVHEVEIFDDILNADVLIDVPIAKHHSLAKLTLGMKNLLGVIKNRSAMHRNLGQRLADLTSLVMPDLTVVDAVRMLMDHGPTGGNMADVKNMDTVIVSRDIVAADSYAATLFGMHPDNLDFIRAGAEMGLGTSKLDELRIEEVTANA
jgi:uncharacterized protein (DUF362 family)